MFRIETRAILSTHPNQRSTLRPAVLISYASPVDHASEPEWLDWYNGTHVQELSVLIPEITAIAQFRLFRPGAVRPRFATIYHVPSLDAAGLGTRLRESGASLGPSKSIATGEDAPEFHVADHRI
jgi:hypothetical protein